MKRKIGGLNYYYYGTVLEVKGKETTVKTYNGTKGTDKIEFNRRRYIAFSEHGKKAKKFAVNHRFLGIILKINTSFTVLMNWRK